MEEDRTLWVALNLVLAENLGAARRIIQHFASAEDVFNASRKDLIALGVERKIAEALVSPKVLERASQEIKRLEKRGYTVLSIRDEQYPAFLRETFDPPLVLYCAGHAEILNEPAVSIVGARKPTPYGRAVAEKIAEDVASRGLVVVSGLARGIDSMAHWGALKNGKTVAVLGSGLENIYPKENKNLFHKITESGAVVSEFPLTSPPLGFHFPQRNRIISGLSLAVIVVEATIKSGSLISARLALEQNRDVMAVPGPATSDLSRGANWLIKKGAKLVESWEDVAEELPSPIREEVFSKKEKKEKRPALSPEEEEMLGFLHTDATVHIDDLVEKSELSVSEVLFLLLQLEIKGMVAQSPGKYFQRKM